MNKWQILFNAFIQESSDTWSGLNYCITHDLIVKNETPITQAEISAEGEGVYFFKNSILDSLNHDNPAMLLQERDWAECSEFREFNFIFHFIVFLSG